MIRSHRLLLLAAALTLASMIAVVGPADSKGTAKQPRQHSGQKLLGDKVHTNGTHVIDKVGKHTVSVTVKDGKITSFRVKHSQKGDVQVKKYKTKTTEQLGLAGGTVMSFASYDPALLAQTQDLGWTWIGFSFIDDYGYEEIYWFPYQMIYDGETDAIYYIPLN